MLVRHTDGAELYLVETGDAARAGLPGPAAGYEDAVEAVLGWAREYLCRPHAELGRKGPVCPYAQGSLDRETFYLTIRPGARPDPDEAAAALIAYRDWFLTMPGAEDAAQYRTILTLFPDLVPGTAGKIIDEIQGRLKSGFVSRGLMLGEFYDSPPPESAGLWNEHFRPLRSPVPLLGMRHMVASDLPFLRGDRELTAEYLSRFDAKQIPARFLDLARETAAGFGLAVRDAGLVSEGSV